MFLQLLYLSYYIGWTNCVVRKFNEELKIILKVDGTKS